MRPRRGWRLRDGCIVVAIVGFVMLCTLCIVAWRTLGAAPGEWSAPVRIGLFGMGPVVDVGIAPLLAAATSPTGVFLLDGRTVATGVGRLYFRRMPSTATTPVVAVRCERCRLRLRALGDDPLPDVDLQVTAMRRGSTIAGTLALGAVGGRYLVSIDASGVRLALDLDRAPLATWYGLVADRIPEARVATIDGTAAFRVRLSMPDGALVVEPAIEGFAVHGLGTERLAGRMPVVGCGGSDQVTVLQRADGWLARAVIAAEDQRYARHPGYDLVEVAASMARNADAGRVERSAGTRGAGTRGASARGASTITQQVARMLYVGSARTGTRKLRELLYAVEMEDTLGKARILQLYLATAPWGDGLCGADRAARRYFGVGADRLDAAQAVWLAAMLHAPDTEARRWVARGGIDLARATWIAEGLAATSRARKARIVAELTTMAPPPVTTWVPLTARSSRPPAAAAGS